MNKNLDQQKGQIALIVLVVSAIVLTIGLSLSKKTVNEVKINTGEQMLKEAFNTAESGIDYYLSTGSTVFETAGTGATNRAVVVPQVIGNSTTLDFGNFTDAGKTAYFWLTSHNADGTIGNNYYNGTQIDVCLSNGFGGAVAIDYYYLQAGSYRVARYGTNFGVGASMVANFTASGAAPGTCGTNRGLRFNTLTGSPLLLVVTPVFSGSRVVLVGDRNFPQQGNRLESTGTAGVGVSNAGVSTIVSQNDLYVIPDFLFWPISAGNNLIGAS